MYLLHHARMWIEFVESLFSGTVYSKETGQQLYKNLKLLLEIIKKMSKFISRSRPVEDSHSNRLHTKLV